MHHLGIDLAWGPRNPTGLAALDADGRLLDVRATVDDASVLAWLASYDGPVTAGVDAPLVVRNPTGSRPCEQQLGRDFRPFEAGAHPTNTGRPGFTDGPRGGRIAAAADLVVGPVAGAPRQALEVYPHAATVALFRLGRTLKYKHKPGRDLPLLRTELLRLCTLLESLADASPGLLLDAAPAWTRLVDGVRRAHRKADLRRAEDQVDAVVCAYVALLAATDPARTTTYGDPATGVIVTPTLPPDLRPTPRGRGG